MAETRSIAIVTLGEFRSRRQLTDSASAQLRQTAEDLFHIIGTMEEFGCGTTAIHCNRNLNWMAEQFRGTHRCEISWECGMRVGDTPSRLIECLHSVSHRHSVQNAVVIASPEFAVRLVTYCLGREQSRRAAELCAYLGEKRGRGVFVGEGGDFVRKLGENVREEPCCDV